MALLSRRASHLIVLGLAALAMAPLITAGQNAPPDTPVFHAATRLVQVNVIVRDKNGPVANLAKSDFILTDGGKPRAISVFSVESAQAPVRTPQPLPPNAFSNRQSASAPNSVTIVLLDSLNTIDYSMEFWDNFPTRFENQALGYAKQQLVKFVEDLDPRDRVAIYSLGHDLRVLCDLTSDPQGLRRTLAEYKPTSITSSELAEPNRSELPATTEFNGAIDGGNRQVAGVANRGRAGITIDALLAIAAHSANIPGRKNLVWLTASLPFSGPAASAVLSRANIAVYPVDARGLATSFNPQYRPSVQDAMQALADETGGHAYLNNNDLAGAIRRAVDDAAVTYTLGFYPGAESLDGKPHDVKVRVDRAGLDVRYPRTYVAARDAQASLTTNDVRTSGTRNLTWAIDSPIESSVIGLLARVERGVGPNPTSLRVAGSIDLHNLQLIQNGVTRKGAVDVWILQQDAAGKVLGETRDRLNLQLNQERHEAYLKTGVFFREYVEPKDGLATLRVLVRDTSNGAVGSLIVPASRIK